MHKLPSETKYIYDRFELDPSIVRMPLEIPNIGRNQLGGLFKELGYTKGVEIGVFRGDFSEILLKGNPDMQLIGIDPWESYAAYGECYSKKKFDANYEETIKRMEPYRDNYRIMKMFSMDAVTHFDNGELDFVYVDGNHRFLHVTQDIHLWSQKVRVGGMIAGHDYRRNKDFNTANHTVYVVNAYTQAYRIRPWFLLGTKAIVEGEIRDKNRSWFWIEDGRRSRK